MCGDTSVRAKRFRILLYCDILSAPTSSYHIPPSVRQTRGTDGNGRLPTYLLATSHLRGT